MSKAIAIGCLVKVSVANVNVSHTEGSVVFAKLEELGYPLSEPFCQAVVGLFPLWGGGRTAKYVLELKPMMLLQLLLS
jgi:hypothetical protein